MTKEHPTIIEELTNKIKVLSQDLYDCKEHIKILEKAVKECGDEQKKLVA